MNYYTLIGFTVSNGICAGSKFRYDNESDFKCLLNFIMEWIKKLGKGIFLIITTKLPQKQYFLMILFYFIKDR
ncbi:MAG TPA: hypothetical protein VIR55_01305 [Ignavibacteria bacterium]